MVKDNKCQINQQTDLYVKWCEKNNINNPTSADEVILREELSDTQREWLEKFIESWDMAMNVDKYIYDQNKEEDEETSLLEDLENLVGDYQRDKITKDQVLETLANIVKYEKKLEGE